MGYRRNIRERRKQRRIRGTSKRVMAMLAGTAMLLAGGGIACAATLGGQDHTGQTTERSTDSRAIMLANRALAAKRQQPASMFAYYTNPLVLAQARTATPISQVGTATVTSVNDGKPVDYDTNGSISLKIVFNPDVQFTAGQQILIHLTNGAHQPVYITSVGNARYMQNAAGTPLFSVSTSNTGDLQTDTAGSDILLTALGSVVNMRNVAGSLNLNCNFSGAKIKSDLTSGTSNTISAGSNTLVYHMNPINLAAPQWNSINPYDQSQAWAGQANHIVGYDWTGLANNVLEGKQTANDPRLAAQQIAWQHITADTPFTISAYINAMAAWTSSPDQSLMSDYPDYLSDAIGMVDGVNGSAGISSWEQAAHTLEGHVGETLIASDGHGGYYVASNLGSPRHMPANNMDSMEPQASNNTGMTAIASRLKTMGLDYPGHWQQVVNVKFTTNTDTAQPAHSTWEIAPIGSSFNSPLTGQTMFPSANVANDAAGTPYMPPAAPAKTVGQGVYGNKMSNTTTITTGTGEGGDALSFKDVIDSHGQAYTVSGYKVTDGSQDITSEFEFARTGDTITATWKGGALPANQEFAFSFQVTPQDPTGEAFTDTASVSWNNGAFVSSPQREFETFRPNPDKTWLEYADGHWTPAATGHAWLQGQKMGALVNGQVAAGLADAPTGFTLTDDWQDASWLFDPIALSQVKILETTGNMSDEDVLAHGKDVTSEFDIVRTGDAISASMKPQYLAGLKDLSQPVQYSLLIPGKAWLAGGKGVDQARADYGMTTHSKDLTTCNNPTTASGTGTASQSGVHGSGFAALDAASAFLNQGSETLGGQTVATNTPEACVTIPAEKPAVATLDLTKQVDGTATSDRFSFNLTPGDKETSSAVKTGDITPSTSMDPAASQNKSGSWTEETDKPFADGAKETVSWGAWTFYKPGVYVFDVQETGTPAKGWTYDETVHQVRISVSEDPSTHDLVAETTGDDPLIVNTFKTATPARIITTPATPAGPQSPASPDSPDKTLAVTGAAVLGVGTLGGLLLGAGLFLKRHGTLVK